VLLGRLPPPWRQIAQLQILEGWTRAEIRSWLMSWRSVSAGHGRRLIRQTHAMLRCLAEDEGPRKRWPERYDPGKNPWLTTPPLVRQ